MNKIIFEAVERGASDIHLDPQEQGVVLRYRIDGVLHDVSMIPKQWKRALTAVIKVKTKQMKIEERRRPQDAKIKIKVPSREKPMKGAGTPLPGLRTTTVTGHGSTGSGLPAASPTA